ncbi:MAG: hypothetical protein HQ575_05205 [Candidatus Omnitrophica bacterium]|nr:hypothetical protein [Candidatus Omnitrophota bacterium]
MDKEALTKDIKFIFVAFKSTLPIALTGISTYFLIKSGLGLTPEKIVALSGSGFGGFSVSLADSFCRQSADTLVGGILLLLSLMAQANNMATQRGLNFEFSKRGIVLGISFALFLCLGALQLSDYIYKINKEKVSKIVYANETPSIRASE